ncbi:hypothetical protein FD754_017004 [Muntiacus muntjak]|uniref:Dermokine n=1 Tax=Muntiacus muntjak TaxID=9888 RepID=A0A5N3VSG1_MUNMU|nr:hypothetical protein FD754_017004 [Muntiacus muntjak]
MKLKGSLACLLLFLLLGSGEASPLQGGEEDSGKEVGEAIGHGVGEALGHVVGEAVIHGVEEAIDRGTGEKASLGIREARDPHLGDALAHKLKEASHALENTGSEAGRQAENIIGHGVDPAHSSWQGTPGSNGAWGTHGQPPSGGHGIPGSQGGPGGPGDTRDHVFSGGSGGHFGANAQGGSWGQGGHRGPFNLGANPQGAATLPGSVRGNSNRNTECTNPPGSGGSSSNSEGGGRGRKAFSLGVLIFRPHSGSSGGSSHGGGSNGGSSGGGSSHGGGSGGGSSGSSESSGNFGVDANNRGLQRGGTAGFLGVLGKVSGKNKPGVFPLSMFQERGYNPNSSGSRVGSGGGNKPECDNPQVSGGSGGQPPSQPCLWRIYNPGGGNHGHAPQKTNNPPKPMSVESVMRSNHHILSANQSRKAFWRWRLLGANFKSKLGFINWDALNKAGPCTNIILGDARGPEPSCPSSRPTPYSRRGSPGQRGWTGSGGGLWPTRSWQTSVTVNSEFPLLLSWLRPALQVPGRWWGSQTRSLLVAAH